MRRLAPSLLAAVLLASLASAAGADSTTSSVASTTTTAPARPVYVAPLTGLPDPTRVTKRRAALTIKIDNTPEAHPQSGIQLADIVTEEIVEGGITRLAATFNSRLPTLVGPIRSVRRTDREVVSSLGGIFVCSGGAGVEGSEAILTGTGPVAVFSAGHLQRGTWRRSNIRKPMVLIASNGRVISLRPGQTWIELLDQSQSTSIVPGR